MKQQPEKVGFHLLRAWGPWGAAVFFLLWQVAFQFVYGFLADPIQKEFDLSPFEAASISSVYLLAYGLMQLPAGLLLDRFGVKRILPAAAVLAALSVYFFAQAQGFSDLVMIRALAGGVMAFVFPGTGKIAQARLPASRFALAMALADMCFGVGAVLASGLPWLLNTFSWREAMSAQAYVGFGLALILWLSVRGLKVPSQTSGKDENLTQGLFSSLKRPYVLFGAGFYAWGAGLTFGFGGYWNVKLQESCGCTAPQVSELSTALFAGLALGMLVAGLLGGRPARWRPILRSSTILTFLLLSFILWLSQTASMNLLLVLMLGLGVALGPCSLAFAVAIFGLPLKHGATVVALVNAGGCLSGALLQELPIWLGRGSGTFLSVSVSYLSVAMIGVFLSWRLPLIPSNKNYP
ncbi:MAG: hypothetical protein CL917_14630 [Deltaproteobacteria bacterium]|nr:hypothetical protein [Deltaproteobacteria bacterium]